MTDSKKSRAPESLPNERWEPVVYRGISFSNYMVSDMGRVKSLPHRAGKRTIPGKALRPFSNGQENADKVVIYESGVRRPVSVRTLVATAFLGPRPDGHVVIHQDGNLLNAAVSNLAYLPLGEARKHTRAMKASGKFRARPFRNGAPASEAWLAKRNRKKDLPPEAGTAGE